MRAAGESAQHLDGLPVLIPRLLPCGECDLCRRGRVASCPFLWARPTLPQAAEVLPGRFLLPLAPPALSAPPADAQLYSYAALADALLAPYSGLVRAGLCPGTLCVVLGSGARSALSVVAARLIGAQVAVLSADTEEQERLLLPPYGALRGFDATALDAEMTKEALTKLCLEAGLPAHGLCLLETSGSDAGRARALSLLGAGGTAVLLDRAQPMGEAPLRPGLPSELESGPGLRGLALLDPIVREGCQVLGAGPPHPDLLPELLALAARVSLDLSALTRPLKPAEADAVMAARRRKEGSAGERLTLPVVVYSEDSAASARP